ncbi:putative nucleotidyltransferase substrate binding domain-containing protein [Neptuniibacter sp. CAU 1671]|uniref:putative nucleotidyltransferase substrate binding domain-containing protein n=1 Tax=Neptuniibacter sp. CAU 1671 TaxID=3032593 RepID=UPI0023DB5A86|nr:putative nucleotidyltransferase substrate binding domain-containing protein [Neptuniibacter sp. CAU 1671]MDF2181346.1 putative nucleotidyltransferase substrate binding domain-containing protein [Neptuniibacter sp. CAU 1671]
MADSFKMTNLPFSLLDESEQQLLGSSMDICYFQKGETLLAAGAEPEGVFVILKGRVRESEVFQPGEEATQHVFVHYTNEDYFGAWSAIRGRAIHNFIAEEETICHLIPTKTLLDLMSSNSLFADYFQQNLSAKSEIVAQHGGDQDMAEFMLARVSDSLVRDPVIILEGTSIREATLLMREKKADCLLVKKGNRYGMVTGTDLLDAVIVREMPLSTSVADIASYRLITIKPGDYLFNALILMTQQQIERLVVMQYDILSGVVELTDVLSYFSSHSHVIGLRIERAQTIEDLKEAAFGLDDLIRALVSHGVKTRFAMDLLAAMNGRIIAKLFDLIIPVDMQPHVCLLVMGSEGRGEQIMKTDQDNAIIYRDGLGWPGMQDTLNTFSRTLIDFGFPPCPGNIMVSNPAWVKSLSQWTGMLADWASKFDGEAQMNLAIAVDAKPVAGNPAIFKASRNWFMRHLRNNDVFFSHFAKASLEFDTPLTFFGNLKDKGELDIKKGGIFPIVHGIRTIALECRIKTTNTFARIEELVEQDVFKAEFGRELSEALSLFIQLRLNQQIKRMEASNDGRDDTPNTIELQALNKMERDLLRDALHVVKKFKKHLELRYHLGN